MEVARTKVLWLVKGLGPGGAEQLLLLAAKVADHGRFDYTVAYVRPDKTHLVPEFEAAGITPVRLGAGSRSRLGWLADLRKAVADADVVHAHSPVLASLARLLARTLPRRRRPAVVTTEHNEWSSHRAPTRLLNGLTTPLDDHHWAVSEQVRDTMWPSRRRGYQVLIHGIDTTEIPADADARARLRSELSVDDDEVLVLTVANLRRNKDYPNLLEAARLAVDAEPRLRFAAVGQGPLEAEIRALHSELGLGEAFQLLGFRRDVHELMAAADVFCLGSAHEGLPVAVMEAFAAGLPVVATSVGGLPRQVREGREGLLVPPSDAQALADALVKVARDDDLRRSLAEAARERAVDYDVRTAVTEQERVYAELAAR
ncbi:MAG: glycosyltransferase [Actinomycetes bacterium]